MVRAVGAPAELAVVLLLLFFLEQQFPELRHERKRPHAGFRLGRIGHNLDVLAVKVARRDGMPDRNGIGIEVDGVPLEAEHLAAAQTVEGSQFDGQLQRMALDGLKQRVDLCAVVEAADKPLLLRALDLVGGIVGDHVHLDCVLERPVNDCVIVDDRVRVDALKLLGIEALNVRGRQPLQRNPPLRKVGRNDALDHRHIRGIGRQLDGALGDRQPALEKVRKEHLLLRHIVLRNWDNGDHEALPLFQQKGFRALLVALYGQISGKPRGFPFAVLVLVAQDDVEVSVLFLQVSCDHDVSSFCVFHLPLTRSSYHTARK